MRISGNVPPRTACLACAPAVVAGSLGVAVCLAAWPAPAAEAQSDGLAADLMLPGDVIAFCRPAASVCACSVEGVETLIEPEDYRRLLSEMHRGGALTGAELQDFDRQRRAACDPPQRPSVVAGTSLQPPDRLGRSSQVENRLWPNVARRRQGPRSLQERAP